jgi:hypothetical protein
MELIITLVRGEESKIVSYFVPDDVTKVYDYICDRFNGFDGWYVYSADELYFYLAQKMKIERIMD